MKNIKEELLVWIHLILLLGIWLLLLYVYKISNPFSTEALLKLPEVVFIYLILSIIFKKWLWKWPIWKNWLIKYPNLQGSWEGTLQTNWKNPETGEIPGPIPMVLVIKQTFDSVGCVMYTQESTSYSNAAMLSEDDDSGIQRLSYNYINTPDATIRGRSAIHYGAAILRIVEEEKGKKLIGEYWTSRNTGGNIKLLFKSKKISGSFPEELLSKGGEESAKKRIIKAKTANIKSSRKRAAQ